MGVVELAVDADHKGLGQFEEDVLFHFDMDLQIPIQIERGGIVGVDEEELGSPPFAVGLLQFSDSERPIPQYILKGTANRNEKFHVEAYDPA